MNYKTTPILGYNIFSDSIDKIDIYKKHKLIINTINPHSYVCAKQDDLFHISLQNSDILLPDGIGIVYASKWLYNTKIARITGSALLFHILQKLNNINGKCFFMGTNDDTLLKIKNKINTEFPKVNVGSFAPFYRESFTKDETNLMVKKANFFNPDVLFVGLTAPKQEKWIHKNKSVLNARMICGIGAAFDFYAGTKFRPNKLFREKGMEWLLRFLSNPKKLWRRNLVSMPLFLKDVMKAKINP